MPRSISTFIFIAILGAGCGDEPSVVADSVYVNGKIYTVDAERSWADSVAIFDGRFIAVGSRQDIEKYVGDATNVVDLNGNMAMPGLHDAHGHLLLGGLQYTSSCLLTEGIAPREIISELQVCAEGKDPKEWLVAGGFWASQFPDDKPNKAILDAAFPNTPVFINEGSVHHALVNTKALEIANINESTLPPFGGSIPSDDNGELTGELIETATWLVTQHIPATPTDTNLRALEWAVREYNKYGITSVQEASAARNTMEALQSADNAGTLTLQVAAHFILESPKFGQESADELDRLFEQRSTFETPHVAVDFAKMWIDGSPTPPYFSEAGYDQSSNQAVDKNILIPQDRVSDIVGRLDSMGIKVKMHVAGAGATNVALNAIEFARGANPKSAIRHETGHSNLIIPEDFSRYRELNAVAEVSPSVWHIFGNTLGSPPQSAWQFKTILETGAIMTTGSDWPVTREPNFFPAVQGMLEHGEESIDLASAIDTLTINGALSVGWDQNAGSIEPGKFANMIVLDQNIFSAPVQEIGKTQVITTVFEGRVVYEVP